QVWSPTEAHAAELADRVGAQAITDLNDLVDSADVYIISVKDDAIPTLADSLSLTNSLLVHTSGATDIQLLKNGSSRYGVLYPLQTFSKEKAVDFRTVPIVVEGNTAETTEAIRTLAERLSEHVSQLSTEQRRIL